MPLNDESYIKAVFTRAEELKRAQPSEAVLVACDMAIEHLKPHVRPCPDDFDRIKI